MQAVRVGIATPSYGTSRYLAETVRSVSAQNLPTQHTICFGGPLPSGFQSGLDTFSIMPDPGMVPCWNAAASNSRTEYIGFLADDNILLPTYSEKLQTYLDTHPDCDAVFCNQTILRQNGSEDPDETQRITEYFGRDKLVPGPIPAGLTPFLLDKNSIPLEACLFRRSVWVDIGPFDANFRGAFDYYFLARAILKGVRFGYIPDCLMGFRVHADSYSATRTQEHLHSALRCMEQLREEFPASSALFRKKEFLLRKRLLRFSSWPQRMSLAVRLLSDRARIALSGTN